MISLNPLHHKVIEIRVMQIEKELISLDPHSFERIGDYLTHIKYLQLKLGECGKEFPKKYDQLIELVLMNLKTPFHVFCSSFHAKWISRKADGKEFSFDNLCDLLIKDQQNLLDEGNLGVKC